MEKDGLETVSFQRVLESQLEAAGLPIDPNRIIGKMYRFEYECNHQPRILIGIIKAIEISDKGKGDLNLYVSNPLFWGKNLVGIMCDNGKWMVYTANSLNARKTFFEGNFHLLTKYM